MRKLISDLVINFASMFLLILSKIMNCQKLRTGRILESDYGLYSISLHLTSIRLGIFLYEVSLISPFLTLRT